jgi:hypothetical protein
MVHHQLPYFFFVLVLGRQKLPLIMVFFKQNLILDALQFLNFGYFELPLNHLELLRLWVNFV